MKIVWVFTFTFLIIRLTEAEFNYERPRVNQRSKKIRSKNISELNLLDISASSFQAITPSVAVAAMKQSTTGRASLRPRTHNSTTPMAAEIIPNAKDQDP